MKVLHPNNNIYLPLRDLEAYNTGEFYQILSKTEILQLTNFQEKFHEFQESDVFNIKKLNLTLYDNLPFSLNTRAWKERQKDAKLITSFIGNRKKLKILEIGSYNCWLTNYLAKQGHNVTNIDMFEHENYGLRAKRLYSSSFTSLQMYPEQLFRIQHKFDIIIFNRNWAYMEARENMIRDVKSKLAKNGVLILTGLNFFKKKETIKSFVEESKNKFLSQYQLPLFYNDSKGYLDVEDYEFLLSKHIQLMSYNTIDYLKNKLNTHKYYMYAFFKNPLKTKHEIT